MEHRISDIDLNNAYVQAAQIVAKYGDKYLPIFERLENEYFERKKKTATMERAMEVAFSVDNST